MIEELILYMVSETFRAKILGMPAGASMESQIPIKFVPITT